jgi:hypothetical protein
VTHAILWDVRKSACDRRFNGRGRRRDKALRRSLTMQPDASTVPSVAFASKQTSSDESLQDSGNRARVQVDDTRKLSSRETRTLGHDSKDQPLWTGNAESRLHSF